MARQRRVRGRSSEITISGVLVDTGDALQDITEAARVAVVEKLRVIDESAQRDWPVYSGESKRLLQIRPVEDAGGRVVFSYGTTAAHGYYIRSSKVGRRRTSGPRVHAFSRYIREPVLQAQRELVAEVVDIVRREVTDGND